MNREGKPMLETIMVPLDGSEFARQAVPRAVSLARRADAGLLLVRVHRGFPPPEPAQAPRSLAESDLALERREREELAEAAAGLRDRGVEVETAFEEGPVVEAILEVAEERADLVVMSTHGRGGLSRFWLGSVADGLARACSVPLFFVRPEEDGSPEEEGSRERADAPELEHVLVSLDGSRLARQILATATEIGDLYDARYTLVRVVQPAMLPGFAYGDLPSGIDTQALEVMEETATRELERVAGDLRDGGRSVDFEVVRHASPSAGLLEAADAGDVDLVAMATHGRGGLKRMVMGSVSDKVLRASRQPLLLHRPASGS